MGWLRTIFLGDIGNRLDIEGNEQRIRSLRRSIRSKGSRDHSQDQAIEALQARCDQLELTIGSLVKLLSDNRIVPSAELENMINALESDEPESGA